jgi:hypothetical protein
LWQIPCDLELTFGSESIFLSVLAFNICIDIRYYLEYWKCRNHPHVLVLVFEVTCGC